MNNKKEIFDEIKLGTEEIITPIVNWADYNTHWKLTRL